MAVASRHRTCSLLVFSFASGEPCVGLPGPVCAAIVDGQHCLHWIAALLAVVCTIIQYLAALAVAPARGARRRTATASLSSGILLWPVLVAAAIMLQIRRSALIVLLAAAAGVATFLYGYQQVDPNALRSSLRAPGQLLQYISAYLGSTWTRENISRGCHPRVRCFRACDSSNDTYRPPCSAIANLLSSTRFDRRFLHGVCGPDRHWEACPRDPPGLCVSLPECCPAVLVLLRSHAVGLRRAKEKRALAFPGVSGAPSRHPVESSRRSAVPFRDAMQHGFELNAAAMSLLTGVDDKEQLKNAFPRVDVPMSAAPYCVKTIFPFSRGLWLHSWASRWLRFTRHGKPRIAKERSTRSKRSRLPPSQDSGSTAGPGTPNSTGRPPDRAGERGNDQWIRRGWWPSLRR